MSKSNDTSKRGAKDKDTLAVKDELQDCELDRFPAG
jgi:hypothetical protein